MVVKIDKEILRDLTGWGKVSGLFDLEIPGRIGSQSWLNPMFQSTSGQYKPPSTGIQSGNACQQVSASVLGTEMVDPEK